MEGIAEGWEERSGLVVVELNKVGGEVDVGDIGYDSVDQVD